MKKLSVYLHHIARGMWATRMAWAILLLSPALALAETNAPVAQADSGPPQAQQSAAAYRSRHVDHPVRLPGSETLAPYLITVHLPYLSGPGDASPAPTATPTAAPTVAPTGTPTSIPTASPTTTSTPTPPPTGEPMGTLADGGVFYGLDGVRLGALAGTLAQPITVAMAVAPAPPEALPPDVVPHSSYYRLSADRDIITTIQEPLLVGVPVPSGADVAHLALGVLDYQEMFTDEGERAWYFLDGLYDSEEGLFLTTLPFLSAEGRIFILAEHFSFDSPANGSEVQSAGTRVGVFTVGCRNFAARDDCTPDTEEHVATYLDQIYHRMTDDFGFPPSPRLQSPLGGITMREHQNSLRYVSGFSAVIVPRNYFHCDRVAGLYRAGPGMLYLCYDPVEGITSITSLTLIHEYFHAIQFSYSSVYAPRLDAAEPPPLPEPWIIEGMASMAEGSYFLDDTVVRSVEWGDEQLLKVDISLRAGVYGDDALNEYHAQDFWVYIGKRFGQNLGYLDAVLRVGATTEKIADALEAQFGEPFDELYWGFVKNQVIENRYDLGNSGGTLCHLNDDALAEPPIVWNYDRDTYFEYPHPSGDELFASIPPLQAQVIEIKFPAIHSGAYVEVIQEACAHHFDPHQRWACQLEAQKSLHAMIYVQGAAECHIDPHAIEGRRMLHFGNPDSRYFVVLANADLDTPHGFFIVVEPGY